MTRSKLCRFNICRWIRSLERRNVRQAVGSGKVVLGKFSYTIYREKKQYLAN